ncbi:MAG: hypothetical protein ABIG95_01735 [Candidatus Woesearchaeota archaeon]
MLIIAHFAVGVLIAHRFGIALSLLLCLLSHFVLDAIPHWDPKLEKLPDKRLHIRKIRQQPSLVQKQLVISSLIQLYLGMIIGYLLAFKESADWLFVGGFVAVLPDMYEVIADLANWPTIHFFEHRHIKWYVGIPVQVALVLLCLYLVM